MNAADGYAALGYLAMGLVLAGCAAYAASILAPATAERIARAARATAWRVRYAPARILHPQPGLPDDGDALSFDEIRALAGISKERSRT